MIGIILVAVIVIVAVLLIVTDHTSADLKKKMDSRREELKASGVTVSDELRWCEAPKLGAYQAITDRETGTFYLALSPEEPFLSVPAEDICGLRSLRDGQLVSIEKGSGTGLGGKKKDRSHPEWMGIVRSYGLVIHRREGDGDNDIRLSFVEAPTRSGNPVYTTAVRFTEELYYMLKVLTKDFTVGEEQEE